MINKVTPRKLNPSLDSRLRNKDEMLDALNVEVKSDNDGESGDVGVLKPIKGSGGIEFSPSENSNLNTRRRVIGSVTDEKNNIIFYFLFSEAPDEQGVYAYDPNNVLSDTGGDSVKTVYRTQLFNFPENGFVKADVVYTTNHEICNLYFTDNRNEPRRLDVKKAMSVDYTLPFDITDFITACPKTPMHPISFEFVYDSNYKVSEFRNIPGFQFAYQCIYDGGEESAISTYSDIAVPPSYVQQGTINTPNLLAHNTCRLTIPKSLNSVDVYTSEISKVRILGRIGNNGSWYIIDEVNTNGGDITYDFRNDRVLTGVPDEDIQKQFTSLPRKAQAQTVVDNRLFYGNYVEGFNEPEVNASMTVYYRDRATDFINLQLELEEIVLPNPDYYYNSDGIQYDPNNPTPNRRAGYRLKTDNLPDSISAGTVLTVNLTVHPDRYFRIYDTEGNGGRSHHASKELFGRPVEAANEGKIDEGLSLDGQKHLTLSKSYFGNNNGVLTDLKWAPEGGAEIDVVCGTSASNPLSIQGRALNFGCTIQFNQDIQSGAKSIIRNSVCQAITGGDVDLSDVGTIGLTVLNSKTTSQYSYNIGLNDEDGVDEIPVVAGDDFRKNLINAVGKKESVLNNDHAVPCGFFIINSADVKFSLRRHMEPQDVTGNGDYGFLYLNLDSLTNISTKNCLPKIAWNTPSNNTDVPYLFLPVITEWLVYGNSYAQQNPIAADETILSDVFVGGASSIQTNVDVHTDIFLSRGYLSSSVSLDDDLFFTVLDGESGPGGTVSKVAVNSFYSYEFFIQADQESSDYGLFLTSGDNVLGSVTLNNALFGHQDDGLSYSTGNALDPYIQIQNGSIVSTWDNLGDWSKSVFNDTTNNMQYLDVEDLTGKASQVEIIDFNSYLTDSGLTNYDRSFKTEATHDFGIVYYDERGRAGNVNKLPSIYVPGYSAEERGSVKGRVEIGINLGHTPPPWAHHYQIVYAGNSSISDFVQYTTGGAFVAHTDDDDGLDSRNIYVSLNYLQQHPTVSYTKDFGAVSTDGTSDIYTFKRGDRLRIVSYYTNNTDRIWPRDYEFDIVDSVILTSDVDTNPLVTPEDISLDSVAPAYKTGRFLILKDSSYAVGFSYQDVAAQDSVDTNTHHWNDRCVVEIYSPLNKQNAEDRVYYEIGKVYNIITYNGVTGVHQTNPLILRNGDVWWRRVPVNMPDYDEFNNVFKNIITGDTSPSKFRDYYLECKTFNDTLINADQFAWGKVKTISPLKKEIRRESSITYSDKNNYASQLVRFTSFNPYKLQFKDLPAEYGAINYILNHSDSIFCIQEEKTSHIPVDRSILSDASGVENLIASSKVLGTQRFFAGSYGCDDNPESVVMVDNFVYFANKSRQEVYRFSPENGISVISEDGMKQFFRRLFNRVISNAGDSKGVRIVGGYDPLKDEFLISIMNTQRLQEPIILFYEPPTSNVIDETTTATTYTFTSEDTPDISVAFSNLNTLATQNSALSTASISISDNIDGENVLVFAAYFNNSETNYEFTTPASFILALFSNGYYASATNVPFNTDGVFNITINNGNVNLIADTDYDFVAAAFINNQLVAMSYETFTTQPTAVAPTESEALYILNVNDLSWTTNAAGNAVSGFTVSASAVSSLEGAIFYGRLFRIDDISDLDINEGDEAVSSPLLSYIFSDVYPNLNNFISYDVDADQITEISYTYYPTITTIDSPLQNHVFVCAIVREGIIEKISSRLLPGFVYDVNTPPPSLLEFVDENGVTYSEAEAFSSIFQSAVNSYFQSLAQNEEVTSLLTPQQISYLNNYNNIDNRRSDINVDNIVGTADLLALLAYYGQGLYIDYLYGLDAQALDLLQDTNAILLPPGSINED